MKETEYVKLDDIVGVGTDVHGLDIGPPTGWTGNELQIERSAGAKKLVVDATGHKIINAYSANSINVFPGAGHVEVRGGTAVNPGGKCVSIGIEKRRSLAGDFCVLSEMDIEGDRGTFGVHSRNFDLWVKDCTFDTSFGQHALYAAGWSKHGIRISGCELVRSNYEGFKVAWRPWESPRWVPRTRVIIEDCDVRGCDSGIVLQGTGCDIKIQRTMVRECRAGIRVDNGLSPNRPLGQGRYYDHRGVPEGPGAANGGLLLDNVIVAHCENLQLLRIAKESPLPVEGQPTSIPHTVTLATTIRNSGFYGEGTFLTMREMDTGHQVVTLTPVTVDEYAHQFGIDTSQKAEVFYQSY